MSQDLRVGPGRLLVADSISDAFGDWTDLGLTRGDALLRPEPGSVAIGRADQSGITGRADAVWFLGPRGTLLVPILATQIDLLLEVFPGAVKSTVGAHDAMGFGSGTSRLTPKAFCLVAEEEYTAGSSWFDEEHTIWIPKGTAWVTGEWPFGLPEGEDALAAAALQVEVRCTGLDATLAASARGIFYGPRSALI